MAQDAAMANTISIAVSEPIVDSIDERVRAGGYGNRSEYFRDLVRKDQQEQALGRLRALIEEGLASGPATDLPDHLDMIRLVGERQDIATLREQDLL
jgi:antitoxin ParD1/3/4